MKAKRPESTMRCTAVGPISSAALLPPFRQRLLMGFILPCDPTVALRPRTRDYQIDHSVPHPARHKVVPHGVVSGYRFGGRRYA